jgi:PleD family two-component response regulator
MSSTGTKLEAVSSIQPQIKLCALLVEDNALDAALVMRALFKDGFDVSADVVQDEAGFTKALHAKCPEIVLADYNLPTWKGLEVLKVLRREGLDIPMILVSGALGDVTAVECIKQGATDYVLKDGLARLPEVVRRALREKNERSLRRQMEENLARKAGNWRVPTPTWSSSPMWHPMICRSRYAWSRPIPNCLANAIRASLTRTPTNSSVMPPKEPSACRS